MLFWLGTHMTAWLGQTDVPLFVSARRLRQRVSLPVARGPWALDSGGFSELSLFGRWQTLATQYAAEVRRWRDSIGRLEWAAPQDWMCEPEMLRKTGLSVEDHQRRTVVSVLELRSLAPDLPWAAVVQGWDASDYPRHVEMYARAGIDLTQEPIIGVGTMCRRQAMPEAGVALRTLKRMGLRLHAFGFKLTGLRLWHHLLDSSDSLAWSYRARRSPPLPGHTHRSCANCLPFALRWRGEVLATLQPPAQLGWHEVFDAA